MRAHRVVFALILATAVSAGCVVYEPVPAYVSSQPTYERSWNAALGALQDAGVSTTSADRTTGVIRGVRDSAAVTVSVVMQADGRTRVQIDATGTDAGLAPRISEAYERRMGR